MGSGGLSPVQRRMLEVRHAEGNQAVWSAAAGQPHHVRAYAARLIAIEDLLLEVTGLTAC